MVTRCPHCREELLGAVNRCWKCGQSIDDTVAGSAAVVIPDDPDQPLDAVVMNAGSSAQGMACPQRVRQHTGTSQQIDARRAGQMAMGGTVASLVLGVFAVFISLVWPPAALIGVLGLGMGLWGLYSPRRGWALVGMLLCCLAVGIGTVGAARHISSRLQPTAAGSTP
jgi:hypothetical protein